MPILNVKVSAPDSREKTREIAAALSELTATILGKDPNVTAIAIDHVDPDHWIIGGKPLTEHRKSSFFLDIKITDSTNTKDDKARYIAAVFERMGVLLGDLHTESYVHVHDVHGYAYGYGGLTQEYRYVKAKN